MNANELRRELFKYFYLEHQYLNDLFELLLNVVSLLDDSNLDATDSGMVEYKGSMVKADMRDQMVQILLTR